MRAVKKGFILIIAGITLIASSVSGAENGPPAEVTFHETESSTRQWTGIAISPEGRLFVNFPRWSPDVTGSVYEIILGNRMIRYPNPEINTWDGESDYTNKFVCVQSVYCDREGYLWVLDSGNPMFGGCLPLAAKLVKIDLASDEVVYSYVFLPEVAPENSYLNDVRIDSQSGYAYITDSGAGGLIVLNLETGEARRVLDDHYSTHAEDITIVVGGVSMAYPDGTPIQVHSDGIALSPNRDFVYYQALTGRTLYRIATEDLRNAELSDEELGSKVEKVAESGAADGIIFDDEGYLYLSAIEDNAIKRLSPDGTIETLTQDDKISWPDSFAIGPDGSVYFTTSRIHEGPAPQDDYKIYRLKYEEP